MCATAPTPGPTYAKLAIGSMSAKCRLGGAAISDWGIFAMTLENDDIGNGKEEADRVPRGQPSRISLKRAVLQKLPLFSTLSSLEIDRLVAYARLQRVRRGEVLFSKGDVGSTLIAVVSGAVKICVPSSEGKEIVLNVIQPGEVFGEISLLDGQPRTANALCMFDSEILTLDRREFIPFLKQNPDVMLTLLAVLCGRLRRTSEQVEDVLFLELDSRLAKMLLLRAQVDSQGTLRVRATQKELGQMIGLSRESTNKQLQIWSNRGFIQIEKGSVIILNHGALQKFSGSN
jgi:CRP/FNR family cyclic AMP-dependent transcriptional regulator